MSSIRKWAGQVVAFWCALLAGSALVLCGGSLQAQTALEEFKKFLTNPPPSEEIVFERKILVALPPPPGVTNWLPTGPFFQLRLQTNAYVLRQMDVIGEAPQNHRPRNLLEGEWADAFWTLSNGQLNLWPDKKQAKRKIEVERSMIGETVSGLGLDPRINRSTLVWRGGMFTAQGADGARFEGMIESKTAAGQPERIVTWAARDPDQRVGVDYEYRKSFHPWFPATIKPFSEGGHRTQEFYVRSLKIGGSPLSQDSFFPTQFTNANTLTILHTKGGMEFFDGNRKLNLVQMSSPPPPRTNNAPLSASAAPTNAPLPAAPSANKGLSLSPAPPPSNILLIAAVVCLSVPVLLFVVTMARSKSKGA
ncbi:MAG: hypothetical protein K0Q55_2009 [Verrucomicrobia bacterium]|nr:hypothetical protein [Verrucomicrobiota bacterium]